MNMTSFVIKSCKVLSVGDDDLRLTVSTKKKKTDIDCFCAFEVFCGCETKVGIVYLREKSIVVVKGASSASTA
jgi:hypothetical protein